MNDTGDFEQFVASRSAVLLRTAHPLCAGDRAAAEDMVITRPHVYWAGTAKAGKYAVVLQELRTDANGRS